MVDFNGILRTSYNYSVRTQIAQDGRPLADLDDTDNDGDGNFDEKITYSEGASYALLRAVEMNDRATFDKVWLWVQANLQRKNIRQIYNPNTRTWQSFNKNDHLFAWRYTPDCGSRAGGVMSTNNDFDPASDADQDIAAALIQAHQKWGSGQINYQGEGLAILNDVWNKETKVIAGRRVLIAGVTQDRTRDPFNNSQTFGVNTSYFRPSYYDNLFASADPAHNWRSMVATAYELIEKAADATMHDATQRPVIGQVNLNPDWIAIDSSFNIHDYGWNRGDHKAKDFFSGGDAFRILFWMATRLKENPGDPMAKRFFSDRAGTTADFGPYSFLRSQLNQNGTIFSSYRLDGTVHWPNETPQSLAAYMVYFWAAGDNDSANKILARLQARYDSQGFWQASDEDSYYAQHWVALAMGLMNRYPTPGIVMPSGTTSHETTLPREFNRYDETPAFLVQRNRAQIDELTREINSPNNQGFITNYNRAEVVRDEDDAKMYQASRTMFDLLFVRFLKRREIAEAGYMDDLNTAIRSFSRAGDVYQKSQIAFILAAEPDRYRNQLNTLGFGRNLPAGLTKKETRYRLYQEIHAYYSRITRNPTIRNLPDPELEGEMILQLAINAPNRETANRHYAAAQRKFDLVLTNQVSEDPRINRGKTYAELSRVQHPYEPRRRLRFARGNAQIQKAQILLALSGEEVSPTQALGRITAAYNLLKQATRVSEITDLFFVQIKQMAAECLLRASFILKDLNQPNTTLSINGRTGHSHNELLRVAGAFLADNTRWINGYNTTVVTTPANRPLWVRQMEAFNYLWQVKEEMFRAGETRTGQPKYYSLDQLVMLQNAERNIRRIIGQSDILEPEIIADARRTLAENLTRQAFIAIDFNAAQDKQVQRGQRTITIRGYAALLGTPAQPGESGRLLAEIAALAPTEKLREIQAEARVWLGKIALAQADKEQDRETKEAILASAMSQLQQVFGLAETGRPLLRGTSLSSALQTIGDIFAAQKEFNNAGLFYRLAIGEKTELSADELSRFSYLRDLFTVKTGATASPFAELLALDDIKGIFGRNYFAVSGLGDILNWQGRYADALPYYRQVPRSAVVYTKAQLGILEAQMRTNESYTPQQIAALETRVQAIFTSEPPASSLILRGLDDLTEAYRTNEDLQERIVFIGRELLGSETPGLNNVDVEVNGSLPALRRMLAPIDRESLDPRVKANLYLNMAEALLWRQRFDEALDLPLPADVRTVVENRDIYRIRHGLIQAEAKMRRDYGARPFLDFLGNASLENSEALKIALREKDPDLAARIIQDLSEAYVVEESWPQAVAATTVNPALLGQISTLFESRRLGYRRLELGLAYQRVEANIGGKEFAMAETAARSIAALTAVIRRDDPYLSYIANRGDAAAQAFLGDLYSYRWSGENFISSRERYTAAQGLISNDQTKESRLLRAKTFYGLGQIHNFGRPIMNAAVSRSNYEQALAALNTLPERSIPRIELMAKIYLGLATLEQKENNQAKMREYLALARDWLGRVRRPPKELVLVLRRMENSVQAPNASVAAAHFSETSSGGYHSTEDRLTARFQLTLMQDQYIPGFTYHADNRHSSLGDRSLGAAYLGLRANPDFLGRLVTLDLNYRVLQTSAQEPGSSAPKPTFFRQPNLTASAQFWTRYFTASASTSQDFGNSNLNTYYLSAGANSAGFFPRWPVQAELIGSYSAYHFLADGRFPARQDFGLDLKIRGDVAEMTTALNHNTLTVETSVGFVPYQHEEVAGQSVSRGFLNIGNGSSEERPDYLRGNDASNPFWGPIPLRANIAIKWNPGRIGVFQAWGGVNYQSTDQFSYRSTIFGVNADFAQFLHF
ncbi:MAG: glycosyl hydrolase family 8 [Candidatus Margulisiibacteriota bacterium]